MDLLNMNPNSPESVGDAPLVIGQTFCDPAAGIYITPWRINHTNPPFMDVFVKVGTFPPDRKVSLRTSAGSQAIEPGESVDFIAEATPAGPWPHLYSWDFGDGTFDCGHARVRHYFETSNRDYVVHAFVTDLEGHSAERSEIIASGRPTAKRLVGIVSVACKPLDGVRVNIAPADAASNELMRDVSLVGLDTTLTDEDGHFFLVGLGSESYTIRAFKSGYYILPTQITVPALEPSKIEAVRIDGNRTDRPASKTTTLHVHARIDGTDELSLTGTQASWRHLAWDWPTNITLNNSSMDPHNVLPNSGSSAFLAQGADISSAVILKESGRGTVDMVLRNQTLVIRFDDPAPGSADYDLDIEFEK